MTDQPVNSYESGEVGAERIGKMALLKELWEKTKTTVSQLKESEKLRALNQKDRDIGVRTLVLTGLALAEAISVAELINEGSKWAAVIKKGMEMAPKIKKEGKIANLIPDLYPDLPDWFVGTMAGLDTLGAPYVGVAPEVMQIAVDTLWNSPKNKVEMGKEAVEIIRNNFFNKTDYARGQVKEAQLVFAGEEGN